MRKDSSPVNVGSEVYSVLRLITVLRGLSLSAQSVDQAPCNLQCMTLFSEVEIRGEGFDSFNILEVSD